MHGSCFIGLAIKARATSRLCRVALDTGFSRSHLCEESWSVNGDELVNDETTHQEHACMVCASVQYIPDAEAAAAALPEAAAAAAHTHKLNGFRVQPS